METLSADIQHPASQPMDFAELREIVRERFSNYQHWLLAFDDVSKPFIDRLAMRFYSDADGDDFAIYVSLWQGRLLGVAAMKKRRMTLRQLAWELRKAEIGMTEAELSGRDVLIMTGPASIEPATALACCLMNTPGESPTCAPTPVRDARVNWLARN